MGDESEWESVNDVESKCSSHVLIEMPPDFQPRDDSQKKIVSSYPSSITSSTLNKFEGLQIKSGSSTDLSSYIAVGDTKPGDVSVSGATLGSLVSNFEVISLASGEVQLHCKRCSARYPLGTKICGVCYLALCANPCLEVDEQIARALQIKEEEAARGLIATKEKKFLNLQHSSTFTQANFLTTETLAYLESKSLDPKTFRFLTETDMTLLSSAFIKSVSDWQSDAQVSLGFVSTNEDQWNNIRLSGFCATTQEWHWIHADGFLPSHNLGIIPENEACQIATHFWIVAMVDSFPSANILTNYHRIRDGKSALPLVCFDSQWSGSETIHSLVKGLQQIVEDFFESGLQLVVTSNKRKGSISDHGTGSTMASSEKKRRHNAPTDFETSSSNMRTKEDSSPASKCPFEPLLKDSVEDILPDSSDSPGNEDFSKFSWV